MSLKVTCPKNSKHNRFVTTAHEMHDWLIDPEGNFVKDLGAIEVTDGPTPGNLFTCDKCGASAKVEVKDEIVDVDVDQEDKVEPKKSKGTKKNKK